MPEVALSAVALEKRFGGLKAVSEVSLDVRIGEIHAVIGPNGAGKSTLINLLSGDLPVTAGSITIGQHDVTKLGPDRRALAGTGRSYQKTTIFPQSTVFENVRLAAQCRRTILDCWTPAERVAGVADRAHEILALVELQGKAGQPAATIGHGLQRHLEIAIALACEPRLLLLDEPTAGMSPEETERTIGLIKRIAARRTVILVEHKMKVVMEISDRITVLHQGAVLAEGTPAEIREHADVQAVYLGTRNRRPVTV